jgi:hypothetical protein
MHEFSIKRGDTRPSIEAQLLDENHDPRDLQNADNVTFHMERVDTGETVLDASAIILNESEGKVLYEWQDGDTDETGRFDAEFEVSYAGGGVETFPNNNDIEVYISDDIA